MKNWKTLATLIGLACIVVVGCGKGGPSGNPFTAGKGKLFASDEGLKTLWDTADAAYKTNDYYLAAMTLRQLLGNTNLTESQRVTLIETDRQFFDAYSKKVKEKDPSTQKSQEQFKAVGY